MIMIGSLGAGWIMRKTGKYYWLEITGAFGQSTTRPSADAIALARLGLLTLVTPPLLLRHHYLQRHLPLLGLQHARVGPVPDAAPLGTSDLDVEDWHSNTSSLTTPRRRSLAQGLGFSCVLTTTLVALLSSVPREQISVATGGASQSLELDPATRDSRPSLPPLQSRTCSARPARSSVSRSQRRCSRRCSRRTSEPGSRTRR